MAWCSKDKESDSDVEKERPRPWAEVRRRAQIRSLGIMLLALFVVFYPIVDDRICADKNEQEEIISRRITLWTGGLSMCCLALVLSSQMKWWLTSPFLSHVRWHILLDSMNVWLFHFLACQPGCGSVTVQSEVGLSLISMGFVLFLWFNKLMGFTIIKTHLAMLEAAFARSLGSVYLDYLLYLFGLSIAVATICLVSSYWLPRMKWLVWVVMLIETCVVLSCFLVCAMLGYAFCLAHRYAKMEAAQAWRPGQKELALKAVHFSKRMRWEAPLNMIIVASAFAFNVLWLGELQSNHSKQQHAWMGLSFYLAASIALANCARFGSLLSLVEFPAPTQTRQLWHMAGSMTSIPGVLSRMSSGSSSEGDISEDDWQIGHEAWDHKTESLARRGMTLRALLEFYGSLPDRMSHFDPSEHKTADVVHQVIIPLSREGGCGAFSLMGGKALVPDRMVTHSWSNRFACLIACVVADALEMPSYASILKRLEGEELLALKSELYWKGKLNIAYWICCFSINQHAGICGSVPPGLCDPVTGELPRPCACDHPKFWSHTEPLKDGQSVNCEMNKFDDMMRCIFSLNPGCSQVIAVDMEFNLFTRAWCVAEIHQSQSMDMPQRMIIYSEENLKGHERWLHHLKVEEMKASNPADVSLILSKITDTRQFDAELQSLIFGTGGLVQACHIGFERVSLLGAVAKQGLDRALTNSMPSTI